MYFAIQTPNGTSNSFQKHAYQLIDDKSATFIHYVGDEKEAVDFHHGNSTKNKKNQINFVRTSPSCMKKCESLVKGKHANIVYKEEIANES